MRRLAAKGVQTDWFHRERAQDCRTLVINKRYDAATLETAAKLKRMGARIVVDLCDNRFIDAPDKPEIAEGKARLHALVGMADHVVVSTATLADQLQLSCPQTPPLTIIGDLADDLSLIPVKPWLAPQTWLAGLSGTLRSSRLRLGGRVGLVWFGSHGSPYGDGGMTDLLRIRQDLEALDKQHPLYLSVLSNHREKFESIFRGWSFPVQYFEWQPQNFNRLLRQHSLAVIPITPNDFTACKTDNRIVTAFGAGLAVVADAIPSYLPYRAVIPLGDWQAGLKQYIVTPELRVQHVQQGRRIAATLNDPETITRKWIEVLNA